MAFVPFVPGVVAVAFNMVQGNFPAAITFGARFIGGAATATDGLALATLLENFWGSTIKPQVTADLALSDVRVTDLSSSSGWVADYPSTAVGTHSGNPVQSQVALVVTLQTAKRGRSFRGRNFWPGLPQSGLYDTATWGSSTLGAWDTIYASLAAAMLGANWTHVVLSRTQAHTPLMLGEDTLITSYRANAKLGTIRGRLS